MNTKKQKSRSFVVVGLGTFGSTIASELAKFGNHVLGIDSDERAVSHLADTLDEVVIADGREEEALREAGVENYDVAIVAIGENLEANVLCTMNLKLLGVSTLWVKALNRTHQRILYKLGADRIILPEQEIGQHIAQMLHNPLVRDYLNLGNGYFVVDFQVPDSLNGKRAEDCNLDEEYHIRCLGLMRDGEYISCYTGRVELHTDDKLLLLGRQEHLRAFGDSL